MFWEEKRRILQEYDLMASGYDRLYSREQMQKYETVKSLPIDSPALDCGCGTGLLLKVASSRLQFAVGVDFSIGMLTEAKKALRQQKNCDLIQADTDHLPIRNRVFGTVLSFTLFQNVPSVGTALHEIARVSKENGILILSALKKKISKDEFVRTLRQAGMKIENFFDQKDLRDYIGVCRQA